ncbi:MAG: hypothetical protein PWP71_2460 [Clostridia bacterium]|nr:hypothetical protein [Clostridia bacterium]
MEKTLEQRVAKLEREVAELKKAVQPKKFVPEDSSGKHFGKLECKRDT